MTHEEMMIGLRQMRKFVHGQRHYPEKRAFDALDAVIAALKAKKPLAEFNWLLQRDESGDWCLEWVRPGDEFQGDEEIPVTVTITQRGQ